MITATLPAFPAPTQLPQSSSSALSARALFRQDEGGHVPTSGGTSAWEQMQRHFIEQASRKARAARRAKVGANRLPRWATKDPPDTTRPRRPPIAPPSGGGVLPSVPPRARRPSGPLTPGNRIPRPPRTPRPARAPRAPRAPRDPTHPRPTPAEQAEGWGNYCIVHGGKWQGLAPTCHNLHEAQARVAAAAYTDDVFIKTEDCADCGGVGCGGPLGGLLGRMLPGIIDPAKEATLIRAAVERRRKRRRVTSLPTGRPVVATGPATSGCLHGTLVYAIGPPGVFVSYFCLTAAQLAQVSRALYIVTTTGQCNCATGVPI